MSGQISDLMFQILARDSTRPAFDSAGKNADVFANRLTTAGKRAEQSIRSADHQVGNLGAQFNDIGVQLAGGQSPFLIALQQGTQITQAFGNQGVKGALSLVGGALLSLLNPISLVTIGLIAAAGYAVQYFTSASDSEKSAESLKQQAGLIDEIGKKWASTIPELNAFIEARRAAEQASNENTGVKAISAEEWSRATASVETYGSGLSAVLEKMRMVGASDEQILSVAEAFDQVTTAVGEQNVKADDLIRLQGAVNSAFGDSAAQGVPAYKQALDGLIGTLNTVLGLNAALSQQAQFEANLKNSTLPTLDPLGFIDPDRDQTNRANAVKSQFQIAQEAALKAASSSSKAKTEAEKHEEAIKGVVEALDAERAKLGLTATEQRVMDELRKAGATSASAEGQMIAEKVRMLEGEKAAIAANAQALDFAKTSTASFFTSFRQGWLSGASAIDAAKSAALGFLDTLATKLEQMAADKLITSLLGGIFGGVTGGFTPTTTLAGFRGVGASSAAPPAQSALKMASAMPSGLRALGPAASERLHVTVGVSGEALNIRPDVESVVDGKGRVLRAEMQIAHKKWEEGQSKKLIRETLRRPRVVGAPG